MRTRACDVPKRARKKIKESTVLATRPRTCARRRTHTRACTHRAHSRSHSRTWRMAREVDMAASGGGAQRQARAAGAVWHPGTHTHTRTALGRHPPDVPVRWRAPRLRRARERARIPRRSSPGTVCTHRAAEPALHRRSIRTRPKRPAPLPPPPCTARSQPRTGERVNERTRRLPAGSPSARAHRSPAPIPNLNLTKAHTPRQNVSIWVDYKPCIF